MAYERVIPRDLFNEAKLLKCLGMLWIMSETNPAVEVNHDGDAFHVDLDEWGLHVVNVQVSINGTPFGHATPYNSRDEWPLVVINPQTDEVYTVFDGHKRFNQEFLALIGRVGESARSLTDILHE